MRRISWGIALWVLCSAGAALACGWYSGTVEDELDNNADLFELISGQVPHHGELYWTAVLARARSALESRADDRKAKNDEAYALIQLGRFDEAETRLRSLESDGAYETLSNLGVLLKKTGRFEESAAFLQKALKLNPQGHLGLGDFYLMRVRFSELATERSPEKNFLNRPYEFAVDREMKALAVHDWAGEPLGNSEFKRLASLLKADAGFADAYLVLGDELVHRGQLNLALWSFVKAKALSHPRQDMLDARIALIIEHWREAASLRMSKRRNLRVEEPAQATEKIMNELRSMEARWRKVFGDTESALVAKGELPSFSTTSSALKTAKIATLRPKPVGLLGQPSRRSH